MNLAEHAIAQYIFWFHRPKFLLKRRFFTNHVGVGYSNGESTM